MVGDRLNEYISLLVVLFGTQLHHSINLHIDSLANTSYNLPEKGIY